MSESRLWFDAVNIIDDGEYVRFKLNFICPVCRSYLNGRITDGSPRFLGEGYSVKKSLIIGREVDVNRQVSFTLPCCSKQVDLYVAVYKPADSMDIRTCVSVEPIPDDWWNTGGE